VENPAELPKNQNERRPPYDTIEGERRFVLKIFPDEPWDKRCGGWRRAIERMVDMGPARNTTRRMSAMDAMILLPTSGAAFGILLRLNPEYFGVNWLEFDSYYDFEFAARALNSLIPSLAVWSCALLLLHFRRPRPSLRRLSRRPGFVACLSTTVIFVLETPPRLLGQLINELEMGGNLSNFEWADWTLWSVTIMPISISFTLATTWIIQAICGRWKPSADWLDRLGRATGCLWLAMIPIELLAS
jgi:hypothetical protein